MFERQPALLAVQLTEMTRAVDTNLVVNASTNENALELTNTKCHAQQYHSFDEKSLFRLKLYLLRQKWHFCVSRSRAGWNFAFRIFIVLPESSPVVRHVFEDNVDLLRGMFLAGEASPWVVVSSDNDQMTLLAVSFDEKLNIQLRS